ncbi:MAG: glutamate--tRNA ligase [Pseudomonadota bacterium]
MTDNSAPIVRFAPSPTGKIHIGNARPALFNWLYAQAHAGQFILRYDDTDAARSTKAFADQILVDLNWLGIQPDRIERQSERFALYDEAATKLKAQGLLYPCYETPDELDRKRKRLLARGLPPIYGREGYDQTPEQRAAFEANGLKPHWRFKLPNHEADDVHALKRTDVTWTDLVRGEQSVDLASMSDPVLIRGDGTYLYTLPSCVDDLEMGVTTIIRGDDHVTNTGAQIALFEALGGTSPGFGHHNLLTTASGEGLSKRLGSLSIESLAADGYEPMAVVSLATLIGTSQAVEAVSDMGALVDRFAIETSTKSAAKFSVEELDALNARLVHELPFEAVADRLASVGIKGEGAGAFWMVTRGNLDRVSQASEWWPLVSGDVTPVVDPEDEDFVSVALKLFPDGDPDETTWGVWTKALKAETGRKGRGLFMPLRKVLTGKDHGPEIGPLLPLIGRERIVGRLRG